MDTFAERLQTEVVSQRSMVVVPLLIEAWAHTARYAGTNAVLEAHLLATRHNRQAARRLCLNRGILSKHNASFPSRPSKGLPMTAESR